MINDAINPPLVVTAALPVSKTCPEIYGFISPRLNCSLPLPGNLASEKRRRRGTTLRGSVAANPWPARDDPLVTASRTRQVSRGTVNYSVASAARRVPEFIA